MARRPRYERRRAGIAYAADAVVVLRIVAGLAWLNSAFVGKDAKFSPDFFSGAGLTQRIHTVFIHETIVPGGPWFLTHIVVPNAHLFAALIALGDCAIGISLTFGLFARVGGALAIARALTNMLIAGGAGADTIGFNAMLVLAGAISIATAAGRRFGIDAALQDRFASVRLLRILG